MTKKTKVTQLSLILVGTILILATYFFYPNISENKFIKEETVKEEMVKFDSDKGNLFENVEYKGSYGVDKTFTVRAEKSYILKEEPNIVHMANMKVVLYMNDERIIIITSEKGKYNKITYDCFFEDNVKASDGETIALAENLDLLMNKDFATIYNNVVVANDNGSVRADKVEYDFKTKYYQISMFDDKKVKIQLTK